MKYIITILLLLLLPQVGRAEVVTGFDDIRFWVGSGSNRAGLAIDWVEQSDNPPSLVWGYRWDGAATGEDMLRAITAADDRLFAKVVEFDSFGLVTNGIGYDANNNGYFALDDGTDFGADGIAVVEDPTDGAMALDSGDLYTEGWFDGYWNYGGAVRDENGEPTNPFDGGSWEGVGTGLSGRQLVNNDWDSLAFTATFDSGAFATNPAPAAVPEPGAAGLLALGLGGVLWVRRRRTQRLAAITCPASKN